MRTFAVARTAAQWCRILVDLAPENAEQETIQLAEDIREMLRIDADRTGVSDLPAGMIGDVQHAKPIEALLFNARFAGKDEVESTHHAGCYKGHPECAYALGVFDTITHATNAPATPRREP